VVADVVVDDLVRIIGFCPKVGLYENGFVGTLDTILRGLVDSIDDIQKEK
jgi:hypothetical protein